MEGVKKTMKNRTLKLMPAPLAIVMVLGLLTLAPQMARAADYNVSNAAELDAALTSAADGDAIRLSADITCAHTIVIDGKALNFDMGDFNLTVDTTDDFGLYVHSGGKLIQSDGVGGFIISAKTDGIRASGAGSVVNVRADVVSAESGGIQAGDGARVTADGSISGTAFGINAFNLSEVTFTGCMTAHDGGVVAREGAVVAVNGSVMAVEAVFASDGAVVTVSGDVAADKNAVHARGAGTDVSVNGRITSDIGVSAGSGAEVSVSGAVNAAEEYIVIDDGVGGYVFFSENDGNTSKPGFIGYTRADGTTVWVSALAQAPPADLKSEGPGSAISAQSPSDGPTGSGEIGVVYLILWLLAGGVLLAVLVTLAVRRRKKRNRASSSQSLH
jgi:hypothetical protein